MSALKLGGRSSLGLRRFSPVREDVHPGRMLGVYYADILYYSPPGHAVGTQLTNRLTRGGLTKVNSAEVRIRTPRHHLRLLLANVTFTPYLRM
jgi:hypothetical protein